MVEIFNLQTKMSSRRLSYIKFQKRLNDRKGRY